MNYMMKFNPVEDLVTYWDEPTITMDYDEHELHSIIHTNWKENKIPNVVLSCATLLNEQEIKTVFTDFKQKFEDAEIHTIKVMIVATIPILNKQGLRYCHICYMKNSDVIECVNYCRENRRLIF